MSTTETRDTDSDNYIVLSQYDSSNNLEIAIAQALVQSAYQAAAIDISGGPTGIYTSPANDSSWNYLSINGINSSYIDTTAISNYPSGRVTEYSVISSSFSQDISLNSYTTNISSQSCSNNEYDFTTLNTSAAIYDANYVVTQNLIADCSDNQSGTFVTATFDVDASNANIQYAMQSRWNTTLGPYDGLNTVGPDPTSIQQDSSNNTLNSFAYKGTGATDASYQSYWYSCGIDGSLNSFLIDPSYQPITNNLLVGDRDLSGVEFTSADVGIYRIQQPNNIITTKVTIDGSTNFVTTYDLLNMPLFNGYGGAIPLTYDSSKNNLPVPGIMTAPQFTTLFNTAVNNTVADDWTFTIDISSNNGGYDISGNNPLMDTLNNDNLLDNPYYMENYVSNNHSINFSSSNISIDPSTNGVSTDASSIVVDLTSGETLDASYAGVDGQIIINTNTVSTRYTDLSSVDVSGSYYPLVFYSNDPSSSLSSEEMENPYFAGMWQKVAQNSSTTDPDYWLKSSNNAIMTLYTNQIVDNSYNTTDFDFSFNNTAFTNNDIQLWRITGSNNIIVNPQSLYEDPSYTQIETGFSTAGVLTGLTDDLTYNTYRVLLTAKTKDDISLQTAVTDVSGWDLNYVDPSATYLTSDSNNAFSQVSFPSDGYNSGIINYINDGNNINYSYTYYTIQDSSGIGGLVDYVDISYNYNGNQIITIPQSEISRSYDLSFTDVSYVTVDPSLYEFTNSFFNKTTWELVYVTSNSKYTASFPAKFGPFNNIELNVNNIIQTDLFYAIRNTIVSGTQFAPHSSLKYVSAPSITNLQDIDESISPLSGNSLQINGTLTSNDIKPFMSIVQAEDNSNNWIDLGNPNDTDVYYGLLNSDTFLTATVELNIEYSQITTSNTDLSLSNYYIPFVYDQSNNVFTLESFTASTSTIGTNTTIDSTSFLGNTTYLTLSDGYDSATAWVSSEYTLTVEHSVDSTTFIVKDQSASTVITITALDNTIFLGTYIVSYIPRDYYRVERLLGSYSDPSYNESFLTTDYNGGYVNLAPTLQGLFLNSSPVLSDSNNPKLGGYQSFRIKGDYMSINPIGTTTSPTSAQELGISTYNNNGSLDFQYVDPSNSNIYSAMFIFPKYRGYNSYTGSNPDQYYTIQRDATSVTFDVSGSGALSSLSDTLSSNMYYGQSFVVDNLQNTSNELVANLNVTSSFNYSIPPSGSILNYIVNVTGDSVIVSINNPNYIGDASNIIVDPSATPVVDPKLYIDSMTLKDYGTNNEYTFSGSWYLTNELMAIRPSRVKLNNLSYSYDAFSYEIKLLAQQIPVYKAKNVSSNVTFNWLGNPALKGTQDPDVDPSDNDWVLFGTYDVSSIYLINGGISIGKKVIYQNPELSIGFKLVYIVSTPTYYKFEQISTDTCPLIPYNYNTEYTGNREERYMPFIDTSSGDLEDIFNPFAPTVTYIDINGNTTNITTDPSILNNITFTLSSAPTMTSASSSSTYDTTRYGIIVPGTNLTISTYVGFYSSTDSGSHSNPIWVGPVTSIPTTPDIVNNSLILRNRDSSGGIYFSALQYPADIGYPSGAAGYQELFKTDISSNWYNIDFYIGNSAWFNHNDPITYFDVNAHGITPTLYTVEDINNPLTQINKRRVYKYTTSVNIDIDVSNSAFNGLQTFNLIFNNRTYYDFDISMNSSFPSGIPELSACWKYNELLQNTIIPNTPISWNIDASYSGNSYVSWAFGNSATSRYFLTELFSVQDNQTKWTYIHLLPFMRYLNQFNMQVGSVAWDGSITAPLVNTRVVALSPGIQYPLLQNNTYTIQEYSESTL